MWHRSEGEGRDILFIHGWTMDHRDEMRTYEPVFALRPGWRRHYIDLPGMGQSPPQDDIGSMDDMLAAVVEIIQRKVKDRRFLVAGTSAGAYLARGVLARLGDQIDGVLLRAPLIVAADDLRDVDTVEPLLSDASVLEPIPSPERERLGDVLMQTAPYVAALREKVASVVAPANDLAHEPFLSKIRDDPARYAFSFDVDAVLAVSCPSLIVTGRHDSSVGYRDAWRLVDTFTRSTFVVLDRAEHGLPIDQQKVFTALVNEWLDRVEEYRSFRQDGSCPE